MFYLGALLFAKSAQWTKVSKEQTKLLANAIDRTSTALLAIGVLTPISALYFGSHSVPMTPIEPLRLGVICYLVGAWVLHLAAQRTLRGLNP